MNGERAPFIVYADFECLIKPSEDDGRTPQIHEAFSVGYYVKCSFDDSLSYYRSYRQTDEARETPAHWFVMELRELARQLNEIITNPKPMDLEFDRATHCHMCKRPFGEKEVRVRDHCHITGR